MYTFKEHIKEDNDISVIDMDIKHYKDNKKISFKDVTLFDLIDSLLDGSFIYRLLAWTIISTPCILIWSLFCKYLLSL